ncbi:MAG: hypothetical protein ACK5XS_07215 [Armatimonadota bacterium]|nr:hypothetical protein CCB81_08675 [Armatimonadetes bacterium Uphvl-Ar2]MCE2939021.1 hypothetical protein [Fimbriimonadaceae bacterium]MCZ8139297.1 hypothetical protein [Fimbriimonadaceae bacterium]
MEETPSTSSAPTRPVRPPGASWGMALATITFVIGVGLVVLTFWQAYQVFTTPAAAVVGAEKSGQPVQLQGIVNGVGDTVTRVILLLLMAGLGSIVATRGIRLFEACLGAPLDHGPKA